MKSLGHQRTGFSLVEIVFALGIVAFAIVAILGMVPTGLTASHGAQDDTRAAQIAQAIFASMASQAQTQFTNVQVHLDDNSAPAFDLAGAPGTTMLFADNNGKLTATAVAAVYAVAITTDNAPAGFDSGFANKVTVSVRWPPAAANQTKRNFVRIISKY